MATRTSQNDELNEQKQRLCTPYACVLHFDTFLCRPRLDNRDLKIHEDDVDENDTSKYNLALS